MVTELHTMQSIKQYIQKKGISYFLNEPSAEDVAGFKGILFDENGNPIVSNLYDLAEISVNSKRIIL